MSDECECTGPQEHETCERHQSARTGPTLWRHNETVDEVDAEIFAARRKFHNFHSLHEGYGVLAEEVAELFGAVRANNIEAACLEAIQVAAMAIRFVEDLRHNDNALGRRQ